jgi:hypothetical protein
MRYLRTGTSFEVVDLAATLNLAVTYGVRVRVATDHDYYDEMVEVTPGPDPNLAEWLIWRCADTGAVFLDGAKGRQRSRHRTASDALLSALGERGAER